MTLGPEPAPSTMHPAESPYATERRAAQEGALLHAPPDLAVFAVTGSERTSWLNGVITANVEEVVSAAGVFGLAVGKTGKILAPLWILAANDALRVILPAPALAELQDHFNRHLVMEDAELGPALARPILFSHGPRSRELVALGPSLGAEAAMVDWTGRRDAAVFLAPEGDTGAFAGALLTHLGDQGAMATEAAWDVLRVAWGVPRWGVDFDDKTLPQEASLEKLAVSFSKGCYLGQETVVMLERRGHAKKRLMRLRIGGAPPVRPGADVLLNGDPLGVVTSVAPDPEGAGHRALGFVKFKHATEGLVVTVDGRPATLLGLAAAPLPHT